MSITLEGPTHSVAQRFRRVIGHYKGQMPGPTVIAVGGLHGNEPTGIFAIERVMQKLTEVQPHFVGEFIGLSGNLKALDRKMRFLDNDLNRIWFKSESSDDLVDPGDLAEAGEFHEIWKIIDEAIENRQGELIFIDLHTTSAISPPFCLIGDTLRNRRFVEHFPVPIILGLEEQLDGPLLSYLNELGFISFGYEAGQHEAPESVVNHEAMLWMVLEKAGCVRKEELSWFEAARNELLTQASGVQHVFEIRRRHGIQPSDNFRMKPGYTNFQEITRGEVLAHDKKGPIEANETGRIFMPLYQPQGDDGFFEIHRVAPFWLSLSVVLRTMGAWRMLPWLPGVRRDKSRSNTLVLNTRIARFFGREIFHLMGYRKRRKNGDKVTFTRRKFDREAPAR